MIVSSADVSAGTTSTPTASAVVCTSAFDCRMPGANGCSSIWCSAKVWTDSSATATSAQPRGTGVLTSATLSATTMRRSRSIEARVEATRRDYPGGLLGSLGWTP